MTGSSTRYDIVVQYAKGQLSVAPAQKALKKWALQVLKDKVDSAEITIRIVAVDEMTTLNSLYRQKNTPTNVLSFPLAMDDAMGVSILGDIVICAEVVNHEARAQGKSIEAHWAHMVIHGVLHLLGYDHEKKEQAALMEAIEIKLLQTLGFQNPYEMGEI